jgi:MinD superfamily P-loop ATPase
MEIAIISGKGGTGKSSITAAFASIANNVVLADCDVDAANMHIIMNPTVEGLVKWFLESYTPVRKTPENWLPLSEEKQKR